MTLLSRIETATADQQADLLRELETGTGTDNALDVRIEIALFEPDETWGAVRSNSAGTKVIYTRHDGTEKTFWAAEWTLDRKNTAAIMKAKEQQHG